MKKQNSIGKQLLKDFDKRQAQNMKEIYESEDFKYFKKHIEILSKK